MKTSRRSRGRLKNEEPYHGYNLPEIDVVGGMEDEKKVEDTYDKYLGVEVCLPGPGEHKQMAKVIKKLKGNHHRNPILYTSGYLVQFPDGETKEITANLIVE